MNCPECNHPIDYRFLSNCPKCSFENVPPNANVETYRAATCSEANTRFRRVPRALSNSACVFTAAFTGLVAGAFVFYFIGGLIYLTFFAGNLTGGEACARGTAAGALSILIGSFLGTVGGTAFAVKHVIRSDRPSCC